MSLASRVMKTADLNEYLVSAPARLHLGFVDLNGGLGRQFGSIGLAITGLDTSVRAVPAGRRRIVGDAGPRVGEILDRLQGLSPREVMPQVDVERAAPAHAGLGSGTQLALAVASAATRALGIERSARELAMLLGRGQRSGIGIATFEQGGFIVDGGRGVHTVIPPVLARIEFPTAWRCVLIFDDHAEGLSGRRERAAFTALPAMTSELSAVLAREVLVGLLPALAEAEFDQFSRSLATIQRVIGDYFAPAQGGRFSSAAVGAALGAVAAEFGLAGIGQSSWGPTGFIFTPDEVTAVALVAAVEAHRAKGLRCQIVSADNVGARLSVQASTGPAAGDILGSRPVKEKETGHEEPLSTARL